MSNRVQFGLMGFLFLIIFIFMVCEMELVESACGPSRRIKGTQAPEDQCDPGGAECCQANKFYTVFECSPPVSKRTKATLTLNDFQEGGDGGGASKCDGKFHSGQTPVVALSTGWFNGSKRCNKQITIFGNGRSARATVVDECDSTRGCDSEHGFQPPCPNNIVDASPAVWEALGVPKEDWGLMPVFWSDN